MWVFVSLLSGFLIVTLLVMELRREALRALDRLIVHTVQLTETNLNLNARQQQDMEK